MGVTGLKTALKQHATDYGMIAVLALLCAYYSVVTFSEQDPVGAEAAAQVAKALDGLKSGGQVLIVARPGAVDEMFTSELRQRLETSGL
ncbi:MAG: ABC transporter permease, partial [Phycisphaerae bacterium]|nr:ABC transporter permease [Phycisphaerae bacterium]